MLTISTIKNTGGAARYYAKEDNYYLSEADAKEASLWWGKGAAELGLSGRIEEKELQKLLEGKLPNGLTVGLHKDGTKNHRPGYDICFHAPKSVSILALDGGDKRFYNAHLAAVKEALQYIERDCAQSRVYKNDQVGFEDTKNLTVALVRHTVSRELDPHLHHHALVMNITQRQDKAWRALASNAIKTGEVNGFSERVYHNQIYYGLIYKTALASKIRDLGCQIEVVGKHGLWEIKGVSQEARDIMSKRRRAIEERIDKLNYRSLKAADVASLDTRKTKPEIKLDEIKKIWKAELASIGFSSKKFIEQLDKSRDENSISEKNGLEADNIKINEINKITETARQAIKDTILHLSQYNLKLDYAKIITQALEFSIGKTTSGETTRSGATHADMVNALNAAIKDNQLIPLNKSESLYVTKELIETEKSILDIVDRSKNTNIPIYLKDKVIDSISEGEAKKYAIKVLLSNNRLSLVEHHSLDNTGLTAAVLSLAEASGKTVRVLSPNRMMANDTNENIKRKPNNLWQWLVSLGKPEIGECIAGFKYKYQKEIDLPLLRFRQGKDVIIVNSAETLGASDMHSLLDLTEKTHAKVIFLRDLNAKTGFTAGNSMETLKQAGIETFKLSIPGKVPVFAYIPELKPVKDDVERTKQLANAYAQKEDKDQNNTIVFVGSKEQIKLTNNAIREELKNYGRLSGIEHNIQIFTPIYMSKQESIIAHKYHKDMVIRFYGNHTFEDWDVKNIYKGRNILSLTKSTQRKLWSPKTQSANANYEKYSKYANCLVFKRESLAIAKGDKLIATANMNDIGIKNASRFVVQDIGENHIELLSCSKVTKISSNKLNGSHFQYDYATTISKHSKQPVDHVLADMKAYSLDKTTINELTSRAKESLTIFTNDAVTAQKRFDNLPIKLTAIEALLDAGNIDDRIDRFINDKTIIEIKSDIEKAISSIRTEHELTKKAEVRAVNFAIEKITSRNAGFTHKDLVIEALEYALKEQALSADEAVVHEEIVKVIIEKRNAGELVMGRYFNDGTRWTTKEILALERSIISNIKKGHNKLDPILDQKTARDLIEKEKTNLTQDQKNACHLITTTKDQFVIVQGYAGTGKTTMFSQVQNMLKAVEANKEITDPNKTGESNKTTKNTKNTKNIEMLALAPTHRAVKELKSIGIEAQTLKSFLIEHQREKIDTNINSKNLTSDNTINGDVGNKTQSKLLNSHLKDRGLNNKLIVLDEFSMVPNQDFSRFLKIVGDINNHVVLGGDIAQHPAIESGKPVEIVQRSNILKTAYLREIVRQKNLNLKKAVESIIHKEYASAFEIIAKENPNEHIERIKNNLLDDTLGKQKTLSSASSDFFNNLKRSIVEIDNNKLKGSEKTLEQMVAEDFLSRTPETRDQTVVIVHANDDRKVINELIRAGLKEQGIIASKGLQVSCLKPKGLTDAEHKFLGSYNVGNIVKFGKKYYHVIENNKSSKSLLLQDETGKTKYFYPEKHVDKYNVELYEHTQAELAVGDIMRLTKTDKERELYANFEYKVKGISENKVILESKDGDIKKTRQGNEQNKQNKQKEITLNPNQLKDTHWDYAYTVTGYGIQGGSKSFIIDFEVSYRKHLANQRSFYIGSSRAIHHLIIYTDNKKRLLSSIIDNDGDKYSALEVVSDPIINNKDCSDTVAAKTRSAEKTNHSHNGYYSHYDAKEVGRLLSNAAESFVEKLLGRPNEKLSSDTQWRYGNKGSLVINMGSHNRGLWHNFETGESGNLLTLIQKETGLSFKDSLKYAANTLGSELYIDTAIQQKQEQKSKELKEPEVSIDKSHVKKDKTSEYAQKLAAESLPITGTIVEKYLKEIRGIDNIDSPDIRYHPKVFTGKNEEHQYMPAMLSLGRDKDGKVQCIQATYLDPKTANKANLDVKKRTYASPSGALVSLQRQESKNRIGNGENGEKGKKDEISFIAEGVETGLSIKDAVGAIKNSDIVVTLGKSNFANIDPQNVGQKIVFCLDNDGENLFTDNTIHRAAQRLIDFGKEVFIAVPGQIKSEKNEKTDFNDIAKIAGISAIRNTINNAVPYGDWKNDIEKCNKHKSNEVNLSVAEKVMQKDYYTNNKIYNSLLKSPEINLNTAIKLIDSEQKASFAKYLNTYNRTQNDLSIQKNLDNQKILNTHNTQKSLSIAEKEIY